MNKKKQNDTKQPKRAIGYKDSMPLIRAVYATIEKMRSEANFDKYLCQTTDMLENVQSHVPVHPVRSRRQSTMLKDSVVEETLEERSESIISLKSAFYETIDITMIEMTNRFEKNDALLTAIDTADEMDLAKLQPLTDLGIELPNQIELNIAKEYIDQIGGALPHTQK